ncbi:TRAP transporter small permease [Marinomonas sp. CT5]|uniref:TRAP transporter small permease n=1 Tax=Marinomonas sp. CT5 TaxID=2066133 RepID=UPI0017AA3E9E|nr:TRAP transporter small permease [Marinomonas sp. CT5]NVK72041.1 TRAP transporter small permease [Oceanospirillaceae bacterium]QUX93931.1 TRAP transporter small permease [Marinomonas sp. CT5]
MKLLNILTRLPIWFGGILIIGVILLTVIDVIARKFFNTGYFGLVDVTQLAVIGFAYLAMPRAFLQGAHVAVELYDDRLSRRADLILKMFALLLSIFVISILLWYGWIQASRVQRYGDVSQNVSIPMIYYWALLLGGMALSWLVCVLQLGLSFFRCIKGGPSDV